MMERASGARLDPTAYSHRYVTPTRYSDLDTQGHVNNIAMAAILEDARSQFLIEVGVTFLRYGGATETLGGGRLVTAAAHYEYLAQAFYPGAIEAFCATIIVGRSSILTTQLAVQNGTPVGICAALFTLTEAGLPVPVGPEVRAALANTMLAS